MAAPARVSLKLPDGWKAWRTEGGRWYLNLRGTDRTLWTYETTHVDASNAEYDARWLAENPGALPLPPPDAEAVAESRRVERVRVLRTRPSVSAALTHSLPPRESVFMGAGTWTHAAGGAASLATDAAVRHNVATTLAASAPLPPSPLAGVAEYAQMMSDAMGADALLQKPVMQRLVTTPAWVRSHHAARDALVEVLAAGYSGVVDSMRVLTHLTQSLLTLAAAAEPAAGAAPSSGRRGTVALDRAIGMFVDAYTPDIGAALAASDEEWWADVQANVSSSKPWRAAWLTLAARFPSDVFATRIVRLLARTGHHAEVAFSPTLDALVPPAYAALADLVAQGVKGAIMADAAGARDAVQVVSATLVALCRNDVAAVIADRLLAGAEARLAADLGSAAGTIGAGGVAAMRVARLREALRFAMITAASGGRESVVGRTTMPQLLLAPTPAAVHVLLPHTDAATGETVLDHAMREPLRQLADLRAITLAHFLGGAGGGAGLGLQADMLPDETFAAAAAAADIAGLDPVPGATPITAKPGQTTLSLPELSVTDAYNLDAARRKFALLANPMPSATVVTLVRPVAGLQDFFMSPDSMARLAALWVSEQSGENVHAIAHMCLTLAAALSQPDVIVTLLHCLFHPTVVVPDVPSSDADAAGGGGGGEDRNGVATLAAAAAWGLWAAGGGVHDLLRAAGPLAAGFTAPTAPSGSWFAAAAAPSPHGHAARSGHSDGGEANGHAAAQAAELDIGALTDALIMSHNVRPAARGRGGGGGGCLRQFHPPSSLSSLCSTSRWGACWPTSPC